MDKKIETAFVLLHDTLEAKNADYGNSAFAPPLLCPGLTARQGILVRMSDKIQRLLHLTGGGHHAVKDESVEDTMLDLAGYIVLYFAGKEREPDDGTTDYC